MKEKLKNGFLILLGLGLLAYLGISGVMDLTNRKDIHETRIEYACEVLELEHSINGLIPIGTDYYFVGLSEEDHAYYIIQGPKNWLDKNFVDQESKDPNGVLVKGLSKRVSDYETRGALYQNLNQVLGDSSIPSGLEAEHFLDLGYRFKAIIKLVLLVCFIVLFLGGWYYVKNDKPTVSKPILIGYGILFFATMIVFLMVLR